MLMFSILIFSCQQEMDLPVEDSFETQMNDNVGQIDTYALPKGLGYQSSDKIISYVDNLSKNELGKLSENYRVKTFLEVENLYQSVYSQLNEGELFTDMDLGKQLTSDQMQRLNDFSLNDISSLRDCYTTPNYPMYKCHDPSWCGSKKHIAFHCYSNNWYCASSKPGETVKQQYCGYPHDVLVRWHLYTCHNGCA